MKNIILIAPPAAGKGTQAEKLRDKYNMAHISTGDILREAAKMDNETGQYIRETQEKGELVRDDIVYELLEERISRPDCANGYILDGFPRNVEQALKYDQILAKLNKDLGCVIILDIPREDLIPRITGRRLCKDCGTIYNVYFDEAEEVKNGECLKCHGELYQRSDDNEESFNQRYQTYLDKTAPLITYYEDKGVLFHVDSSVSKEYTTEQVEKIINE